MSTQVLVDDDIYGGYDDYSLMFSGNSQNLAFQDALEMNNVRRNIVSIFEYMTIIKLPFNLNI